MKTVKGEFLERRLATQLGHGLRLLEDTYVLPSPSYLPEFVKHFIGFINYHKIIHKKDVIDCNAYAWLLKAYGYLCLAKMATKPDAAPALGFTVGVVRKSRFNIPAGETHAACIVYCSDEKLYHIEPQNGLFDIFDPAAFSVQYAIV